MKKQIFLFVAVFMFIAGLYPEDPGSFYSLILHNNSVQGSCAVLDSENPGYCFPDSSANEVTEADICSFDPIVFSDDTVPSHCCEIIKKYNAGDPEICGARTDGYCGVLKQTGQTVGKSIVGNDEIQGLGCSGTLIDRDLFLVAGHCVYRYQNYDDPNYNGPFLIGVLFNNDGAVDQEAPYDESDHFYEVDNTVAKVSTKFFPGRDGYTNWYATRKILYGVEEIGWLDGLHLENMNNIFAELYDTEFGNPDYAIIRLKPNADGEYPGDNQHIATLNFNDLQPDDNIHMAGFPGGHSLKVGSGRVHSYGFRTKDEIELKFGKAPIDISRTTKNYRVLYIKETPGMIVGSSGTGILDDDGNVVGVFRWSDCLQLNPAERPEANNIRHWATPVSEIYKVSPILQRLYPEYKKRINWVTGPGSNFHGNVKANLLPYGANYQSFTYEDFNPILWETDIGKIIPDSTGTYMKYIMFGDTAFLKRNSSGQLMTEVGSKCVTSYYNNNPFDDGPDCTNDQSVQVTAGAFSTVHPLGIGNDVSDCAAEYPGVIGKYFCEYAMALYFQQHGYYNNNYNLETPLPGSNSNLNTVLFHVDVTVDSEDQIKVGLRRRNGMPSSADNGSYQVLSKKPLNNTVMANSIRKHYLEDIKKIMVYPVDSFYVCKGSKRNPDCSEKKLIIPSISMDWSVFNEGGLNNAGVDDIINAQMFGGIGFYNFDNECRVDFANNNSQNGISCDHSGRDDSLFSKCLDRPNSSILENPYILWYLGGKFGTATVISGLNKDTYSASFFGFNGNVDYVYFLGVGELIPNPETEGSNLPEYIPSGRIYLARVPAYEDEVACAGSYEYFIKIENGVSKWGNYLDARPLYDLTFKQSFIGGIVKKDGLFWISVPIRHDSNNKGFLTYASPDGIHWQAADEVIFDIPSKFIRSLYGFNFMPQTNEVKYRDTIPYLYSLWKTPAGYNLTEELNPAFPAYNVALGEYEHKSEGKESRPFIVYSSDLGSNSVSQTLFADSRFRVNFTGVQNLSEITDQNIRQIAGKKNVMIQYCQCDGNQTELDCKTNKCNPSNTFDPENPEIGNWKVMKYRDFPLDRICTFSEGSVTYEYLCRLPFDDSVNSYGLLGSHFSPVWDLTGLVYENTPDNEGKLVWGGKIIMRLSFWDRATIDGDDPPDAQAFDQMLENIKMSPDTEYYNEFNLMHWKTTGMITLEKPKDSSVGGYIEPINPAIKLINYDTLLVSKFRRNITGPGDPYSSLYGWGFADLFSNVLMREGSLNFQNTANQPAQGFLAASKQTFSSDGLGQTGISMALWGGSAANYQTYSYTSSSTLPEADETVLFTGELDHETGDIIMEQIDLLDFEGDMAPVMTDSAHMLFDEKNDILYLIGARDKTNLVKRIYMLHRMMIGDIEKHGWVYVADFNVPDYSSIAKLSDREYLFIGGTENVQASVTYSDRVYILNLDDIENGHQITTIPAGGRTGIASVGEGITGKLYIFGGENETGKNNQLMEYDLENHSWQTIQTTFNGNTGGPEGRSGAHLFINRLTDKLLLNGGFSDDPSGMLYDWTLDLADGSWERKENHSTAGYCLNETGNLIKGGLEMSGTCVPFTHPWYRSFATGSTIYSVAGKGDRLYVGTNNSIKVYDITDSNALVLKSTFLTGSRRVYDLEVVEGDIMYAATSGGIYKLDTANPDTLASLSFFATSYNYQYRIQLYNDKLYVGDDNGINIRHKDTFTRLAYVNVGSVPDFAIANGEIALYRSSFWSSGLHIRDVGTLNLKAYEYAECYTGELTTDHGAFYLSCDGYEYRFEGRPDTYFNYYPLDGDIREMQENHVYNGWTYIPDGSSVKLSTLNDVPSYCGNGVIEPGELCDGNSVACTTISSSYVSGTAYCNSTCNGYNESNCSTDGW